MISQEMYPGSTRDRNSTPPQTWEIQSRSQDSRADIIDRDPDHGDGMFVVFEPSTSPDIMSYEIYAVIDSPFLLDNIATLELSATLSRDWSGPALVEFSSNPTDIQR